MEAKELKLQNHNNCLACDAFVQIHFAPAEPVPERELNRLFHVKHGEQDLYLKLVDILRIKFCDVSSIMTLPATGRESHEWRTWWQTLHPKTKNDTMMCVYYYRKHK